MSAAKGTRARVLEEASKWVGYKEGRGNRTIFGKRTGSDGGAWCGAFVDCVLKDAGVPSPGSTVWVPSGVKAFKAAGQWFADPRPGDVVFFDFGTGKPKHVGIVADVSSWATKRVVTTIEGNTWAGSGKYQGNGDGCYRRTRKASDVLGFGRPKFKAATKPAPADLAEPFPVGHEHLHKPKGGATITRGDWVTVHEGPVLPKGAHFLVTTQVRIPVGEKLEVRIARLGWGAEATGPGTIDGTGYGFWDGRADDSQGQTLLHQMYGGGPIAWQFRTPEGLGTLELPTIVCKAYRDH